MCVVCGCGNPGKRKAPERLQETALRYQQAASASKGLPFRQAAQAKPQGSQPEHRVVLPQTGDLHFGHGSAGASIPGMSQSRMIRIEQDVLGKNNEYAARNRAHFLANGILALNLVSSPGSGKTTLLCETIEALKRRGSTTPLAVIEGDQQTSNDADRIRATGAPAIQINTGKGCHLDAQMVGDAFPRLPLHWQSSANGGSGGILFIENVGNLVCPAMWDLGEAAKVAILSVTEGEDKPIKYPDMFAAARLMILNKTDLLPYLRFNMDQCIDYARRVNPHIEVIQLSATSGEGMGAWLDWIVAAHAALGRKAA